MTGRPINRRSGGRSVGRWLYPLAAFVERLASRFGREVMGGREVDGWEGRWIRGKVDWPGREMIGGWEVMSEREGGRQLSTRHVVMDLAVDALVALAAIALAPQERAPMLHGEDQQALGPRQQTVMKKCPERHAPVGAFFAIDEDAQGRSRRHRINAKIDLPPSVFHPTSKRVVLGHLQLLVSMQPDVKKVMSFSFARVVEHACI